MTAVKPMTILLAAGGTGGHVFPAVAVAEQLRLRGHRPVFITDKRGKNMIPASFTKTAILAASPYGASLSTRLKGMTKLSVGILQTILMLAWHRPKVIIGFGGYPSVAPVMMGKIVGARSMLHEQNAYFGRANRFLANAATTIGLSWPATKNIPEDAAHKLMVVGMPVREAFYQIADKAYVPPTDNGPIHLLIVGGSLGAEVFGKTVPEAISRLPEPLRNRLVITHQVRKHQQVDVQEKYAQAGINARLTEFITNMDEEMAGAHLVIGRAGASSVAELAAAGRPALLVPYPDAMDDHQTANAEAVVHVDGGWLIPETEMSAGSLAGKIATLISTPDQLKSASDAIKSLNSSMASSLITDQILALAGNQKATSTSLNGGHA